MEHIGYSVKETAVRRRWVDDAAYTDLVALMGPADGPHLGQAVRP
jgi:hypothetical protein